MGYFLLSVQLAVLHLTPTEGREEAGGGGEALLSEEEPFFAVGLVALDLPVLADDGRGGPGEPGLA